MKFRVCLLLLVLFPVSGRLCPAVEISEILPDNQGGLRDEDGQSPGWIELRNETAQPADLSGWHLTDSAALPAKWTFPATVLPPGGYLVVFASGKDRTAPGSPLHTNFKLDPDGEYLALTDPGGTVVSGFMPAFPSLRRNISYSEISGATWQALVASGASARIRVPEAEEAGWESPDFADAAWSPAVLPAGYDENGNGGQPLLSVDFDDRESLNGTTQAGFASFVIGSTGGAGALQTGPVERVIDGFTVTLKNSGADGYDDRSRTSPTNSGEFTSQRLLRDFVFSRDLTGNSGLDLTIAGLPPGLACQATVWSFDSSSIGNRISDWSANGGAVQENYTFNGVNVPTTDSGARFSFDATADAAGTLVISGRRDPASNSYGVFLNAVQLVPQGFGSVVTTDVESLMKGRNSSLYLRAPFTVVDPGQIRNLRLRVRYDDGFAAYVNGQAVAVRNAPAGPVWNSAATAARTASEALAPEEILIPVTPGLLRAGGNVLAVQGLNVSAADSDFLLDVTLDGEGMSMAQPRYFDQPTPGAANSAGYPGVVADTKFTVDRGFYNAPLMTEISCATPGAVIRYTLDGSVPTASTGTVYAGPVNIGSPTSLRAAAFVSGFLSSGTDTHTFLFPEQSAVQPANPAGWPATWGTDSEVGGTVPANYGMDPDVTGQTLEGYSAAQALRAIPSLSLSLPPGDFLGPAGIYQFPKSTGTAWERACSVEFLDPEGLEPGFAENCVVEIHGNSSRRPFRVQKHSFRLSFRGSAGASKLDYPLFPGSPVRKFNKLVLRACFTDAWCLVSWDPNRYRPDDATYMRDVWMKRSHAAMGALAPDSRYCNLYINGLYWGVYNVSERLDDDFVASHLGGETEDWEVVSDFVDPDRSATSPWKRMFAAANAGLASPAAYAAIQQWLDPVSFADYYLLHQFGEAEDWPHHNGYAYRDRRAPGGRYQWITWDQEIALNNHSIDRVSPGAPNTGTDRTPGRLLNKLRDNAEFRLLFADRAHRHLHNGGALDIGPGQARWSAIAGELDLAIVAESARWGDTADETPYGNSGTSRPGVPLKPFYTREADWLPTVDLVKNTWIPSLHDTTKSYATVRRLQAAGLYPQTLPPDFAPFGGIHRLTVAVTLSAAAGQIYYTLDGSDPREAVTGNVLGMLYEEPLTLTRTVTLKARARNGTVWSALTEAQYLVGIPAAASNLAVSEIFYQPPADSQAPEFIELVNYSGDTLDLTDTRFSEGISYAFPAGQLLAPGERIVVTGLQFTGKLDNSGEFLSLLAADGSVIFRFRYQSSPPWPGGADGQGTSLVMTSPGADPADPVNWRPGTVAGGTPGTGDATAFSGNAGADSDQDGFSDFLEYAFGTLQDDPGDLPQFSGFLTNGEFRVILTRALAADDAAMKPELSPDLEEWSAGLVLESRSPSGTGRLTEVWKAPAPEGAGETQFVRIRVSPRN